ncbi:SGS domain-containing protein [Gautieria morchelliformis]|nr:SGS domain-containing protein [Gautieria morchelliformis]
MYEPRHEFYETDDGVTISIFDKGVVPENVSIELSPRSLVYEHGDKKLTLDPLTGEIDPDCSDSSIGKFKVEVKLQKKYPGRWVRLVGESSSSDLPPTAPLSTPTPSESMRPRPRKNWEGIAEEAINAEPEISPEDPNAGGDAAVNGFFQKLFADADDDTKKAMMKSYQESGGTTLSTNWADVGKKKVDVKPPEGSEWRKWG